MRPADPPRRGARRLTGGGREGILAVADAAMDGRSGSSRWSADTTPPTSSSWRSAAPARSTGRAHPAPGGGPRAGAPDLACSAHGMPASPDAGGIAHGPGQRPGSLRGRRLLCSLSREGQGALGDARGGSPTSPCWWPSAGWTLATRAELSSSVSPPRIGWSVPCEPRRAWVPPPRHPGGGGDAQGGRDRPAPPHGRPRSWRRQPHRPWNRRRWCSADGSCPPAGYGG